MKLHLRPIALLVLLMTPLQCTRPSDLCSSLPTQVNGWEAVEPDGLYDRETLYTYINGGAEVYRALNMQAVCARRYEREGKPEIVADLFLMGSAADAWGAYHHDPREGEAVGLGQESEYGHGALAFWKGPYFLSIMALEENKDSRDAVLELGRSIDAAISETGDPPGLLRLLPETGLLAAHTRYFHSQLSLYRFYELAEGNPLELGPDTEGLLAHYQPECADNQDCSPFALLLVLYPAEQQAAAATAKFRQRYMAEADGQGAALGSDKTWAGVRTHDRLLLAVLDAPTRAEAERLLDAADRRTTRRDSHD